MGKVTQIRQLVLRSRRLPWLVMGLTLLILAGAIGLTTWRVRDSIRGQIARRDGEVLHAVVLMEYENDVAQGLAGPITDVGSQLGIVLKSSQLKGVLGIRLFNATGQFVEAFPPYVCEGGLSRADVGRLDRLVPVSHYHRGVPAAALFYPDLTDTGENSPPIPVLEVNVPLHSQDRPALAGIAQFLIQGHSIAAEFGRLDRQLIVQGLVVFAVGGGLLVLALGWAFRRLRRTQELLTERSHTLLHANQELALAAKTTALGSVAAHLIHGLKNPLAGLQSYVSARGSSAGDSEDADWQQAVASTRRMQAMINQVVSVLREEQTGTQYEISVSEMVEMVRQRVQSLAAERGVELQWRGDADVELPNRSGHLLVLILVNLMQNAIQATPRGQTVALAVDPGADQLQIEVRDAGPGFPPHLTPFAPCRSSKEGGSGIGLALSKQLANHLGASIELKSSTSHGCVFMLSLPVIPSPNPSRDASVSLTG